MIEGDVIAAVRVEANGGHGAGGLGALRTQVLQVTGCCSGRHGACAAKIGAPVTPSVTLGKLGHFFFFGLFRATPAAFGSSQARDQIRAVAASLQHSYGNSGSKLLLSPTPQLTSNARCLTH